MNELEKLRREMIQVYHDYEKLKNKEHQYRSDDFVSIRKEYFNLYAQMRDKYINLAMQRSKNNGSNKTLN